MIISLASPRFDPKASVFLNVEFFNIGKERIHKTAASLGGTISLQDTGMRMQSTISIITRDYSESLYLLLQYLTANHPLLNVSHPNGLFQIAPTAAKMTGNTITLNALVVGNV